VIYTRGAEAAVIWWTTWDTEADAEEAVDAAREVLAGDPSARAERKNRSVLIIKGLPPKLHRAVRGDFSSFARRIKDQPAPPSVPPDLIY